jgi:hypothetical protein
MLDEKEPYFFSVWSMDLGLYMQQLSVMIRYFICTNALDKSSEIFCSRTNDNNENVYKV